MVKKTVERFGKVDILVNNAGVGGTSPIRKITEELWDRNMAVNVKGFFYAPRRFSVTCAIEDQGITSTSLPSPVGTQVRDTGLTPARNSA